MKTRYKISIIVAIAFGAYLLIPVTYAPILCDDAMLTPDQCGVYLNQKYSQHPTFEYFFDVYPESPGIGYSLQFYSANEISADAILEDKIFAHLTMNLQDSTIRYSCENFHKKQPHVAQLENPTFAELDQNNCRFLNQDAIRELSGSSQTVQTIDLDTIKTMEPNSSVTFYYPDPQDTENRDVYNKFLLIRLPEHLGGGVDDVSAFRAYSAVSLVDCEMRYWSDEGRQRIENPCRGDMYRIVDGLIERNYDIRLEMPAALPKLDLTTDDLGNLYVKPPVWTSEKNGAIGIGRDISVQEIREGSQLVADGYSKKYPTFPIIPVTFAGFELMSFHDRANGEIRYVELPKMHYGITMRIHHMSPIQQDYFLNFEKPDSNFWQIGDNVIIETVNAPKQDITDTPSYKIEFILDGFKYSISGSDGELLKSAIVNHFFSEYGHDDMFLISTTVKT